MTARQFGAISKALADPKRLQILQKIGKATEATTCTCVRDWTGLAPATVSHDLKELESVGLRRSSAKESSRDFHCVAMFSRRTLAV